jgi:hypothetical protein
MEDLFKLTEVFLTSSTILVGALSVARTEPLKTGISILGLFVTILWFVCGLDAFGVLKEAPLRAAVIEWLPALFLVCWLVSFIVHAVRWKKGRHE